MLLILVEPATKLFDYLHGIPKIYDAAIRWGIETDTGDPLGRTIGTGDSSNLSTRQLDDALKSFMGWHDQIPPATSAKRIDGERAYAKAHRGEDVKMSPAKVYLHEANWLSHDLPNESRLRLSVRGGYYVRALAHDLGRLLGCGAHLRELHRVSIGPWNDPGGEKIIPVHGREILPWMPARILSDQEVGELRQRREIHVGEILDADWKLPDAFYNPDAPIRGFHLEKFRFLLTKNAENLKLLTHLRGGL